MTIKRRNEILNVLNSTDGAMSASKLAGMFGVTRQIIVSDIAILRANGNQILATPRGYVMEQEKAEGHFETILCRHENERIRDEFYAVVDNGGCVINVIVEHPLYGQIKADLDISSRYDADEFIRKAAEVNAAPLCDLTDGFHIHMIRVPDDGAYRRITEELSELGILVNEGV